MNKPNIRRYGLSDDVYRLLQIEDTDNTEEKLNIIKRLRKQREAKIAMIVGTILTIILLCLLSYLLYKTDHYKWIFIVLVFFGWIIWTMMFGIVEAIISIIVDRDVKIMIANFYNNGITKADRYNYKRYESDVLKFYRTPQKISWEDIIFKDDEVVFIVSVFGNQFIRTDIESHGIYEDYKSIVLSLLPIIYVYVEEDILVIHNEKDFYEGIEIIKQRYAQDTQLLSTYNSTFQERIIGGIKNKSPYLDYLLSRQVKGLGVIKDKERIEHNSSRGIVYYATAYVFTLLSNKSNHYIVVYENAEDVSTTSIICDIPIENYSTCIATLISYMGRERVINRRETLRRTHPHQIKGYPIRTADHKDLYMWKRMVEQVSISARRYRTYTVVTKKTYKKKRRWRTYYR